MSRSRLEIPLPPSAVLESWPERLAAARDCWPQALAWSAEELKAHAPLAVLRPAGEEGVLAALNWARERGVAIVPRGAGSGVLGACVPPDGAAAVLDLSGLDERFELDPKAAVLRVGAGARGGFLERRLNTMGWSLRHFPQSLEDSSPGGWIAADGCGQLSTRYGGVARQVVSARVAGIDGAVSEEDPRVHLGAEGTLGVITEAWVRVRRLPRERRFFSRLLPSAAAALDLARRTMSAPVPPSVLRLYSPVDAFFNGLRRGKDGGSGSWRQRWEPFALRRRGWLEALRPLLGRSWLAVAVYEEEEDFLGGEPARGGRDAGEGPARRWWEKRYHLSKARLEGLFAQGCFADTADFWAPWDTLAALEADVLASVRPHALAFSHFSHFDADGACLYVTFAGGGGPPEHAAAWAAALETAAEGGARTNHHHGVGLAKLPWLRAAKDDAWISRWRDEKRRRDPRNLLNPGKLCP